MPKAKELIELIELLGSQEDKIQTSLSNKQRQTISYDDKYLIEIEELNNYFLKSYNFSKGEMVKWKKGLKNRRIPHDNQPAIIVDILDKPIYGDYDPGNPYFREPLDILLAIKEDDEFLIFHYDKRRFEPFELKTKTEPVSEPDK